MDFSFANDWDKKEILIPVIDESREARNREGMEVCQNGIEANTEFWWPLEHPIEPANEDQPVKCPMPDSSVIDEEQFSDSLRKRTELSAVMNREGIMVLGAEPARAVRKRHHTSTYGDHMLTPLLRMSPLRPHQTQSTTLFQTLQQFDKYES